MSFVALVCVTGFLLEGRQCSRLSHGVNAERVLVSACKLRILK
jgi:hypothetical protein